MEIRTNATPQRDPADEAPAPPGEKNRYLRRKPSQSLRRSQVLGRRLSAIVPIVGKGLLVAGMAACVVALLGHAFTSDRFRVTTIRISGTAHAPAERLQEAVRRTVPGNLLTADLRGIQSLVESDPWVRRAEVRRVLPSTLAVRIEERVPSTILEIERELQIADAEGVILDRYDSKYGKLDVPVFRGLLGDSPANYRLYQEENSARVRMGRGMLEELESGSPAFTRAISEVDLSDTANVRILLVDDPAEISLGDRAFLKRFRAFMSNLDEYQKLRGTYAEIASIDLRFDGQIIYRPRGDAKNAIASRTPAANPGEAAPAGPPEQEPVPGGGESKRRPAHL
jgi:cell division protein FtsQ